MGTATKPIVSLDLSRDLPKVRKSYTKLLRVLPSQKCEYAAPCVVGAMVPPDKRGILDDGVPIGLPRGGSGSIGDLIGAGVVSVPPGQKRDFVSLQKSFDDGDEKHFLRTLARVEAKYLAA